MLSATLHVVRSSLSLRAVTKRPATLNVRPTRMGPGGFTIRTLISEFPSLKGPCDAGSDPSRLGVYDAPLTISCTSTAKKYSEDHEAVAFDDSTGIGTVSITNYAQSSLGDVVFVELPALKTKVTKGGSEFSRSS